MGKKIYIILMMSLLLLAAPVAAHAASTGGNATGAKLPNYKKIVTINVEKDNFSKSLVNALKLAEEKATNSTQYKIVIPKGTHEATHTYRVPSNTWVCAKGAVIKRKATGNCFIACNPGKSYRNIKIEGGTWDATGQPSNFALDNTLVRFAHVKNLIFQDMTIKCKRGGHIIEVGDINGMTVKGCKISGNNVYRNVQPKEAIQLDVATKSAMNECTPYNGKGCHNVIIENNTFTNVSRGVGSHSSAAGAQKTPYTNITVRNNKFQNLKGEAVFVLNWKYCTIQKNSVLNGKRTGIYLESCSGVKVNSNAMKKITAFTRTRKQTYGASVSGVLLRVSNNNYVYGNKLYQSDGKAVLTEGVCNNNTLKSNKKS